AASGGATAAAAATNAEGAAAAPSAPVRKFTPAQIAFNEGVEALKVNDFNTAEMKFLGALGLDDKLKVAHSALASVYIEKGDGAKALEQANLFLASEPENPRSFRLLYEAHKLLGDDDAAQDALKQLEKVAGGERAAALRYNEGAAALKSGDYDNAKRLLEEALAADPTLLDAVKALGILSINQRDFARAASLADQYLEGRPDENDVTMMKIRWQSYSALGDTEKATAAFDALKAADPTVVIKDLTEAAQVDFNNGRTEEAVARLEQILSIDADNPRAHYLLGLCRINQGNNDEAKRLLNRFIELAPNDPQAAEAKDMLNYI
ncbi:MAG: tetratricopeptide repeat protein, partial [Acidobacteriota bacterium]